MKTSKFFLSIALLFLFAFSVIARAAWTEDYDKALADAKTSKKMILLDFTGSDWCPWCIKLDKDVYETQAFKDYADKNLILVKVDFPNSKPQTDKVKAQNDKLQKQFNVDGFPTTVLLSPDGKKLGEMVGYVEGGPKVFIQKLEDISKGKATE